MNTSISQERKEWLLTVINQLKEEEIIRNFETCRSSLVERLSRLPENASVPEILKWRCDAVIFFSDAWDAMDSKFAPQHCESLVAFLTPPKFDAERECLFCLVKFESDTQLNQHSNWCLQFPSSF